MRDRYRDEHFTDTLINRSSQSTWFVLFMSFFLSYVPYILLQDNMGETVDVLVVGVSLALYRVLR